MQFKDWKAVIADGVTAGFDGLQFIGGEPTLHPNLYELIMFARRDKGYRFIELYSNFGRNLNWDCLVDNEVSLATSFYANDIDLHGVMTKNRSSYHKIIYNIKDALDRKLDLRVSIVLNDTNRNIVEDTIEYLKILGVEHIGVDDERKIGRANRGGLTKEDLDRQLCGACGNNKLMINADGDVYPCIMSTHRHLGNVLEQMQAA